MAVLQYKDPVTGQMVDLPVASYGIKDAPLDSIPYIRKDGEWVNMYNQYENVEIAELIFDIFGRETNTITQEEYDRFVAICPNGKVAFAHIPPNHDLIIEDQMSFGMKGFLFKISNQDGDFIIYANSNYFFYNGHYSHILIFNSELTVERILNYGYMEPQTDDNGENGFSLAEISVNVETNVTQGGALSLLINGDGTKFLSNSGEYKEIEPGISDAPSDGNLYARKNKAWELLNSSNSEKFPILEEIASILKNGSATKAEYDKISSFYDENKIVNGDYEQDYEIAYASFWAFRNFYVADIYKYDTAFSINIYRIGSLEINSFGFTVFEDLSVRFDYDSSYEIESYDNGLSIKANSFYNGPNEIFLETSGDGTKFLADNGEYKIIDSDKLNRSNSYTTATTVASLNVDYENIYVTLTSNASLSASATGADYNGRTITAYVYTAAARTITIPTTGNYVSMCGSSFTTKASGWVEFNLTCIDGIWHIAKLEQE